MKNFKYYTKTITNLGQSGVLLKKPFLEGKLNLIKNLKQDKEQILRKYKNLFEICGKFL